MAEVGRSRVGAATHLAPSGPLNDPTAIAALAECITECHEDDRVTVVIDFARVPVVSSEALESLLDAQEILAGSGGSLSAVNLNSILQDVFYLTNLDERIEILDGSWASQERGDRSDQQQQTNP